MKKIVVATKSFVNDGPQFRQSAYSVVRCFDTDDTKAAQKALAAEMGDASDWHFEVQPLQPVKTDS